MATLAAFTDKLKTFQAREAEAAEEALELLDALTREAAPYFPITQRDHHARAALISAKSLLDRAKADSSGDPQQLRVALEQRGHLVMSVKAALHRLASAVRELPGWKLTPPTRDPLALARAAGCGSEADHALLLAELHTLSPAFNLVTVFALALDDVAREGAPFGDMTLEQESKGHASALARVHEAVTAMTARPDLLARLAERYGVAANPSAILGALAVR